MGHGAAGYRLRSSSSTTEGSARVEMSPMSSVSSVAILRRIRRMILPERVLGRFGAQWITSGVAMGPMTLRNVLLQFVPEFVGVVDPDV